ncbi:hypothetical protein PP7435_CHR1-0435 [Komagataella phaffii CBS 7435]|uniref:TATA-binding protein interacting (TIP20) domain-containing protein n=2 Tax=Komagataella phaffii TaxID=460519 RepID=C4QW67_KOMPG|nr:Hypothetical protein PAS_chr1-1_0128 [Komagataella phaffii GS115]AOA60948.1 GQ67_02703T0 [Komagataella phaffii]CAH2446157.1 hypothetical protein BQ9382_C1-2265 [Komagataella phaffii CBS 7435]AOA66222.1 GQ68_02545T0 [Komagataella phaffii GS115]CAY67490.1 Hypothetical protein PAS_chr1-1_0128 [Komagataella phaffii GS115]CCA36588.1 hypothetical protein PP7435_CHR1-0435 [Komagataella phaffii CBS 7435]
MSASVSDSQINNLFQKTNELDQDLRFMALSDLYKIISETPSVFTNSPRLSSQLITVLIKALKDVQSEIKNQAVKCFKPLMPTLSSENAIQLVLSLDVKPKKTTITSTVYTMAMHNVLENLVVDQKTAHTIVSKLLPGYLNYKEVISKIDYIEIISDLIRYLGIAMDDSEKDKTWRLLIDVCFQNDTLIARKAVVALCSLIKVLNTSQVEQVLEGIEEAFQSQNSKSTSYADLPSQSTRLALLSGFFKVDSLKLHPFINRIVEVIISELQIDKLSKVDDDYDKQISTDQVRSEALVALSVVVSNTTYEQISLHISEIINYCRLFLSYNPLAIEDDDDYQMDNDVDADDYADFSDDDEELNQSDDDTDDISWKLRRDSARLIRTILKHQPSTLLTIYQVVFDSLINQLDDSIDSVVDECLITLTTIIEFTSLDSQYYNIDNYRPTDSDSQEAESPLLLLTKALPKLSDRISAILTPKHRSETNLFLKFFSSLFDVTDGLGAQVGPILGKLEVLTDLNNTINLDLLNFYASLLKNNRLTDFEDYLPKILTNIQFAISSHDSTLEGLNAFDAFLQAYVQVTPSNVSLEELEELICSKALTKNLSSEIRQRSLMVLTNYIVIVKVSEDHFLKIVKVYSECLHFESLSMCCIFNIGKAVEQSYANDSFSPILGQQLAEPVLNLITRSEFRSAVLTTLLQFSKSKTIELSQDTKLNIINSLRRVSKTEYSNFSKKQHANLVDIITHLLENTDIDSDIAQTLSEIIIQYSDSDLIDPVLIVRLTKDTTEKIFNTREFFQHLNSKVGKESKHGARIIATVSCYISDDDSLINQNLENLNSQLDLLYSVQFLTQIIRNRGQKFKVPLEVFLQQLDNEDVAIRQSATEALGVLVKYHINEYLPVVLEQLLKVDSKLRPLYLESLVIVSESVDKKHANDIWDTVFQLLANIEDDSEFEENTCTIASKVLFNIGHTYHERLMTLADKLAMSELIHTKYTTATLIKQFYSDELLIKIHSGLFRDLLGRCSLMVFNNNLHLKQISVNLLVSALHSAPFIALQIVAKVLGNIIDKELLPKREYIKVIQIGPFKHKIDNGLELRKSVYEMIYNLLLSVEHSNRFVSVEYIINYEDIMMSLINKGFRDDNAIVLLSSIILSKLVTIKPGLLSTGDILSSLIASFNKILSKQLKETATKQQVENQQEAIKAVIRSSKKIDRDIVSNRSFHNETGLNTVQLSDWQNYIKEMKTNFPSYYAEVYE